MIVSGLRVSGMGFRGKKTLASIGNMLFWYDYRNAVSVINSGGFDYVTAMADLTGNGFNLTQPLASQRMVRHSDGIGQPSGITSATRVLRAVPDARLKCLHDGSPHMLFFVSRYNNPTDVTQNTLMMRTYGTGSAPGINMAISTAANNLVNHQFRNDAGSPISTQSSATDSWPEDSTYRLGMFIYYGSGGSSNSKIVIGNTSYVATRNPSFSTGNPGTMLFLQTSSTEDIIRTKTWGGYNLTGKTTLQIDAFVTDFTNTLKSDIEYAALTI
jgi:hypothetical protein